MRLLDAYDAFLLDLDGVVWRGEAPIRGSAPAVEAMRAAGKPVVFVTNNSSRTPRDYAVKLMRCGIPTPTRDIVTSGHAVIRELERLGIGPGDRVHACCADGLIRLLEAEHLVATRDTTDVKAVVVGWYPKGTFRDIAKAADLAREGIPLIASNADATYPTETGLFPGTGALLAAITTASGARPRIVGKPKPHLVRLALERAAVEPSRALFVGDRAETDLGASRAAGVPSALVLTGVTSEAELHSLSHAPNHILDSIADVLDDHIWPEVDQRPEGYAAVEDETELARLDCSREGRKVVLRGLHALDSFDPKHWWRIARLLLVHALAGSTQIDAEAELGVYLDRLGADARFPLFS